MLTLFCHLVPEVRQLGGEGLHQPLGLVKLQDTFFKDLLRYPLAREGVYALVGLPS